MTDDESVRRLRDELAELSCTLLARAERPTTGTVEPVVGAAPSDALLLRGQQVRREDYLHLWQWVQDQQPPEPVLGPGDGVDTFTLPDMRARADRYDGSPGMQRVDWRIWP